VRALFFAILLAGSAENVSSQAATSLWGHPRNDPIIGIIAQVPSYGGMWVGHGNYLHGSLTNLDDSTKLRAILTKYVSDPKRSFLQRTGTDYGIVIEKARYSYAQLTEWEKKIESVAPALTSIGVEEMKNTLEIDVATDAAVAQTGIIVARLRIPPDAVNIRQLSVVQDLGAIKH
jgi:hypothetical protein